ncbi:Mpo1-like protein [Thalassotalea sp. PLHSN55]|uniref:Mpo1-like protein n=1 Tax=Thalassotalea sp. PLHSN55 TaxID=3435888 RepID=UPI003F84A3C1
MKKQYQNFTEFYPFYLSEHNNKTCRRLHFVGSLLIVMLCCYVLLSHHVQLLWAVPLIGYGFAWFGHFVFEKNRPATFQYPLYSLLGDWVMFKDMLIGKIKF